MAIYPKMNLGQLRVAARQRADMVNSTFITDDELNSYVNASYFELYDLLVQKYGNDYYVTQYEFNLVGNQSRYDLPEDFFKLLGVDLEIGAGPDGWVSLRPFNLAERNRYSTANVQTWIGVTNLRYRLSGNKLWFTPSPNTGQTIRIWYIPRLRELVDVPTVTVNNVVDGDYLAIGATTIPTVPTVTISSPVTGDYLRIGTLDLSAGNPTLTVTAPVAGSTITIGATTLTEGVNWSIGVNDAATAASIVTAITSIPLPYVNVTRVSNVIYLTQLQYTSAIPLASSDAATLDWSCSFLAKTWGIGPSDAASAAYLASAINGAALAGVTASAASNVVTITQSGTSVTSLSVGSYADPVAPGVATRLGLSSPLLAAGYQIGLNNTITAANLTTAINAAGIVDVSATSNGNVITLEQAEPTDLALSVGNSTSPTVAGADARLVLSSAQLTNGSTVADGISGWMEYVVCDAAIKMAQKEESDTSVLQLQKQALIKRIEAAAENRDAGSPATISDVQWTNGTWPFGNGFGGGGGIP